MRPDLIEKLKKSGVNIESAQQPPAGIPASNDWRGFFSTGTPPAGVTQLMDAVAMAQAGNPVYRPFVAGTPTRIARNRAAQESFSGNAVDRALRQAQQNTGASIGQAQQAAADTSSPPVAGGTGVPGETWWGDDGRLSKDFTVDEFRSRDTGDVKVDRRLIEKLQQLRDYLGVPIMVHSGYRSPEHNAAVGGAKNSQHMYGTAADISAPGVSLAALLAAAELFFGDGGIGTYEDGGFLHLDVGPQRRW